MRPTQLLGIWLLAFCAATACVDRNARVDTASSDTIAPDPRGTETKRNIKRYLECKGRHCEAWFPEGAEAVERRSDDFKEVWDTLAMQGDANADLAQKLKTKKKTRRN